jgi:GDPmannose 4,6-dehydratase
LTKSTNITRIVQAVKPNEIYNLAAQSHVLVSFEEPEYTGNVDAFGALRLLEAIRICGLEEKTKYYQASISELYGLVQEISQKETTPFYPLTPSPGCQHSIYQCRLLKKGGGTGELAILALM